MDGADLCYLSVGTGIAAGIVLNGRPLSGETGLAGEVGHSVVDPQGSKLPVRLHRLSRDGRGRTGHHSAAREAVAAGSHNDSHVGRDCLGRLRGCGQGDELAKEIANEVGAHLARALRGLVLTLGIQRIVIGGGVAGGGDALLDPIIAALDDERHFTPGRDRVRGGQHRVALT